MGVPTKSMHCECADRCKPVCFLLLISMDLIVLGGRIVRKPAQK